MVLNINGAAAPVVAPQNLIIRGAYSMWNFLMIEFRGTPLVIWFILLLALCVDIGFVFYIDKLEGVPYGTNFKDYCKVVKDVASQTAKGFKQLGRWLYDYIYDYIKAHRKHFNFDADGGLIWTLFDAVLDPYAHRMLPCEYGYCIGSPSYIYCNFYSPHRVTEEVKQELLWHSKAVVAEYLRANGLVFELFPVCDVVENRVYIRIYYIEYTDEIADFIQWKHRYIQSTLGGNYGILEEDKFSTIQKGNRILLGVSGEKYQLGGFLAPKYWDLSVAPHGLIVGYSGSGKSTLTMSILKQLLEQGCDVYLCDYKNSDDWVGVLPESRFAVYKDCDRLFNYFFDLFEKDMETGNKHPRYLIFDEASTFLLDKDSKEYKEAIRKLSKLAFLARSFNTHILLIMQQANSDVIPTAIREQLTLKIIMGKSTPESKRMMFGSGCEISQETPLERYCGYISTPDKPVEILQTPRLADPKRLKQDLIQLGQKYRK